MKQDFHLSYKEKRIEIILLILAVVTFIIIGKGIYNEKNNINQDNILLPLIMFLYGIFFLIYSFNGLSKGELIGKWTPFYLVPLLVILIIRVIKIQKEKAEKISRITIGILAFIVSLICFITGVKAINI